MVLIDGWSVNGGNWRLLVNDLRLRLDQLLKLSIGSSDRLLRLRILTLTHQHYHASNLM